MKYICYILILFYSIQIVFTIKKNKERIRIYEKEGEK